MVGERDEAMTGVLGKALIALVAIAVAIALGTFVMVRALGLNEGAASSAPVSDATVTDPLPTTALPVPGEESETPEAEESEAEEAEETQEPEGELQLDVTPQQVGPSERINLTGRYQGADNVTLQVQRFEGGSWADFPVTASVTNGTFQTWIQTSRTGEQRLRMYDAQDDTASNEVTVQVG